MNLEQNLLLAMARDNAEIAATALKAGLPLMAREHLKKALAEIDQAELAGDAPVAAVCDRRGDRRSQSDATIEV